MTWTMKKESKKKGRLRICIGVEMVFSLCHAACLHQGANSFSIPII
jgi:hypothetical protein